MKTVITYGTFDLFHIGHLNLLRRLRQLGDRLIVGVSTDEFNAMKGKSTMISFAERIDIVRSLKCVDHAFPERAWEQKKEDVLEFKADIFGMGDDWKGKFDFLSEHCEVVYLPRTAEISSTGIKSAIKALDQRNVAEIKRALDVLASLVVTLE